MKPEDKDTSNLGNIDEISDYSFDEEAFTTDTYNEDLVNKLNEVFTEDDVEDKLTCTVKALHKYELKRRLNSREKLVIQLFTEQQRLNLFEFFELDSYDDSRLFEKLGMFAVQMNEYSVEEMQSELYELVKVNLEDFSDLNNSTLSKLKRETNKISKKLKVQGYEVKMLKILGVFQDYLSALKVKLADDIVIHYCNYKGWKMIAILRQQESFKYRKALESRNVNLTSEFEIARYYYSSNVFKRELFYDALLEDLKKYERYVMKCYIDQSPSYYKNLLVDYYEIVLTALTFRDDAIDKYKSMVSHGYFNNKTNEQYLCEAINKVYKAKVNGDLKQFKLKDICKKLHITTKRAEEFDLRFLYLYTSGLSQWMKAKLKSDERPTERHELESKWREDRVKMGKKVWKLHVKDKKSFKQISDEKLIDLDRELLAKKFYAYVYDEFVKQDIKEVQYKKFIKDMGITSNQFQKNILDMKVNDSKNDSV
jgi:hypothetical protein